MARARSMLFLWACVAAPPPADATAEPASGSPAPPGARPEAAVVEPAPTTPSAYPQPPAAPAEPARAAPRPLTDLERTEMTGASWHEGCPVGLDELRAIAVRHATPDGGDATGTLIVHADVADAVARAFEDLYAQRFAITKVRPTHEYGGDDAASMRDDNTSGFNCRPIGRGREWSQHAYGRAVDINPLRNPWVRDGSVRPPEGRGWLDRDPSRPGVIVADGPAVRAFAAIGWRWGGKWRSAKDYQHFSENGW
jgi:hypothetical protein